jgi:outer membrane protein assembly factor BamB
VHTSRPLRWLLLALLSTALALTVAAGPGSADRLTGSGRGSVQEGELEHPWPMVGGDPAHSGTTDGPAPPYREVWSLSDVEPLAGPVVGGDVVIVVESDRVVAVDRITGRPAWEADREAGPGGPAALAGNLVIFSEGRQREAAVSAIRLEDGEPAWSVPTRAPSLGGPAVEDGQVYVGTSDGRVLALTGDAGSRLWEYRATGRVDSSLAVADGLVYAVAEDFSTGVATVFALDQDTGREQWRFSPSGPGVGASSISVAKGTAFAGMGDVMVHAFDAASGAERWRARARFPFGSRLVPAAGESVIVGDRGGHLYGVDPGTGEREWLFRVPGDLVDASPVVAGGSAVVGDSVGQASAIDLNSGLLVWKRVLGTGPVGAIASDGERLYLAVEGRRGRLVALEHDPEGTLLAEPSPTTLFVGLALLNFAVAAVGLGAALVLLIRRLRSAGVGHEGFAHLEERSKGDET